MPDLMFEGFANRLPAFTRNKFARNAGSINPEHISACCSFAPKSIRDKFEKPGLEGEIAKNAYALCLSLECSYKTASSRVSPEAYIKHAIENSGTNGIINRYEAMMQCTIYESTQLCRQFADIARIASGYNSGLCINTDRLYYDLINWGDDIARKWTRYIYTDYETGEKSFADMVDDLPPHVVSKLASSFGTADSVCLADCYAVSSSNVLRKIRNAPNKKYAEQIFQLCMSLECRNRKTSANASRVPFEEFIHAAIIKTSTDSLKKRYKEMVQCTPYEEANLFKQLSNLVVLASKQTDLIPSADGLFYDLINWGPAVQDKWSRTIYLGKSIISEKTEEEKERA